MFGIEIPTEIVDMIIALAKTLFTTVMTVDGVIIMACTLGLTEFLKRYITALYFKKKNKELMSAQIRGGSFIIGMIMSMLLLTNLKIGDRIVYGLFYATLAPVLYFLFIKLVYRRFVPADNSKAVNSSPDLVSPDDNPPAI